MVEKGLLGQDLTCLYLDRMELRRERHGTIVLNNSKSGFRSRDDGRFYEIIYNLFSWITFW